MVVDEKDVSLDLQNQLIRGHDGEFVDVPRAKRHHADNDSNEEAESEESDGVDGCPICFEPWTTSGIHRVCSLRCGHVFGKHCIETWLSTGGRSKCPQCNFSAHKKEIRVLYVKNLAAVDNSEKEVLIKQLEEERSLRKKCQERENKLQVAYNYALAELCTLKEKLLTLERDPPSPPTFSPSSLQYIGSTLFENECQCRGLAFDSYQGMFAVGTCRNITGNKSFGISKVSLLDYSRVEYLSLHEQLVKDISCSPYHDGLLLSTSFDKTLRLSSSQSNTLLLSYKLDTPGWSCDFDRLDRNIIYVGQADGLVSVFDIRNTKGALQRISLGDDAFTVKPIHSLFAQNDDGRRIIYAANIEGLIRSELNATCQEELNCQQLKRPNSSLTVERNGGDLILSTRGNHPQHSIWTFKSSQFHCKYSWTGRYAQSSIIRTALTRHSDNSLCLAIIPDGNKAILSNFDDANRYEERSVEVGPASVNIFNCVTAELKSNKMVVGLLTERQLGLYCS